jgi:hypothetical protein
VRRLVPALCVLLSAAAARAQDVLDWSPPPALPRGIDLSTPPPPGGPPARANRVPLFRMTPGFWCDPVGLTDDDPPPDVDLSSPRPDDGPDWLQVVAGNDNPFFDFRRPGDPGGVGYYRLHSQMQLFDSQSTALALGLQAYTPAGLQAGGVEDGPTYVSPALAVSHCLDDGTAFHGFVGRNLRMNAGWAGEFPRARGLQYGLAVSRPLLAGVADDPGPVYLFVEALGHYRPNLPAGAGAPGALELLPGMHWKVTDGWWLSGGVALPVNGERPVDPRLWQITCSFQF